MDRDVIVHRDHDPDVIAQMHERFSGQVVTPAFRPGDAMMLSNWTLHQSHATPSMVIRSKCHETTGTP